MEQAATLLKRIWGLAVEEEIKWTVSKQMRIMGKPKWKKFEEIAKYLK